MTVREIRELLAHVDQDADITVWDAYHDQVTRQVLVSPAPDGTVLIASIAFGATITQAPPPPDQDLHHDAIAATLRELISQFYVRCKGAYGAGDEGYRGEFEAEIQDVADAIVGRRLEELQHPEHDL